MIIQSLFIIRDTTQFCFLSDQEDHYLVFGCFRLIGFKACTLLYPFDQYDNQLLYLCTIHCPCYFVAFVIFIYAAFYCWSFWTLVILWWFEVPLIGLPPWTFCGNCVVYVLESLQWFIRNWCLLWPIGLSYSNIASDQNKYCLISRKKWIYLILQQTFFASENL
jgi:hypothetical protein